MNTSSRVCLKNTLAWPWSKKALEIRAKLGLFVITCRRHVAMVRSRGEFSLYLTSNIFQISDMNLWFMEDEKNKTSSVDKEPGGWRCSARCSFSFWAVSNSVLKIVDVDEKTTRLVVPKPTLVQLYRFSTFVPLFVRVFSLNFLLRRRTCWGVICGHHCCSKTRTGQDLSSAHWHSTRGWLRSPHGAAAHHRNRTSRYASSVALRQKYPY